MTLTGQQLEEIERTIEESLRKKLKSHNPEPAAMPFHTRLLGKDRLALYAFIHSLNTNFGITIFEPVALSLAQTQFKTAERQKKAESKISSGAQEAIQKIMNALTSGVGSPDKKTEIDLIRKVCREGEACSIGQTKIDLYLEGDRGVYLIDLKTAKPNKSGFKELKRTLLEWAATVLFENPDANVHTLIAIPYNPYAPKPYSRWTMKGMIDLDEELKVAEEFWDFVGGDGSYDALLDCFERVGMRMGGQLDAYFARF